MSNSGFLNAPTLSSTLSTASILYGGNTNNTLTSIEQTTIIEKLKELHRLLSTCEEERVRNDQHLDNITKTQERMQNDAQKLYYKQKLKTLYKVIGRFKSLLSLITLLILFSITRAQSKDAISKQTTIMKH